VEESGCGLIWDTVPIFAWRNWGKQWNISVGIIMSWARSEVGTSKIQARNINNSANSLGDTVSVAEFMSKYKWHVDFENENGLFSGLTGYS
jgi:hypothetical protein